MISTSRARLRSALAACLFSGAIAACTLAADELDSGWGAPPPEARLRAYWWWLNGNVTKKAITRDLEGMAAQGYGGALICDAGGAEQDGNDRVPHGPTFFSAEWRELYRHALHEAERLGLELSLNIQSGWNLGGPMVPPDDAPKKLVWSELRLTGPQLFEGALTEPKHAPEFYRDVAVVAYPLAHPADAPPRPLQNWAEKALHSALHFSAPDTAPLLEDLPDEPGEEHTRSTDVIDLTRHLGADGTLRWDVPAGEWEVLRFGRTLNDHCRVSTCSDGWQGYALDPFDADAFRRYWDAVVAPLIADAGPLAGHTLKYLHTDSWEVEVANWTPTLRAEFRARRGYDLFPFLPVVAGRIVDSRSSSNRFLHDFRKTMGDLAVDNHYRLYSQWARRHGLLLHPESGGPHAVPVDSLRCLGMNDAPMSEFWAWSWRHRVGDAKRFFVKQPASAAHTYGRRLVLAEGFTTIGPHWQERLCDNLKPAFDHALAEGLNRLVWHTFTCSPAEMGLPGQEYFAGTHFNPNSTWWSRSAPFLAYINRCQFMLQRGVFVADAVYYYGDHVPNFAQLKSSDPARVLPGYDYDVVTEEVVLTRMSVRDGHVVLPAGPDENGHAQDCMRYRVLVLPDRPAISLPVLRRVRELVEAGATVIGRRPERATGLEGFPESDRAVAGLADELWGRGDEAANATAGEHRTGRGRVVWGPTARELLLADGVPPDFDVLPGDAPIDYIHRRDGDADIYFVANRSEHAFEVPCVFRVAGRQPELWDPVAGTHRDLRAFTEWDGRTEVGMEFAPFGSWFVLFRRPGSPPEEPAVGVRNFPVFDIDRARTIPGPWTVRFDPERGGPAETEFAELMDWTAHPDPGIRFYSGTATYATTFVMPQPQPAARQALDLGQVRELAEVRLNGHDLGVLWSLPFRADITAALQVGENRLEIDIVNFWPNRVIGDAALPPAERRTQTNIRKLTADTALVPSGLLGPVRILPERVPGP